MLDFKNRFVIIVILAILVGWVVGWAFLRAEKANAPVKPPIDTGALIGSGVKSPGEIFKKLDDFTNN